jgi:molybdopterin converting factor small subunit
VILTPGDCPGITPELVAALIDRAAREPETMIVPVWNERRGHPIVLPWKLATEISRLPAGAGVNALTSDPSRRLAELAVPGPDVCADLDTPGDLRNWLERKSRGADSNGEPAASPLSPLGERTDRPGDFTSRITLQVRLYAMAKERAGRTTVAVELPLGACVADLRKEIAQRLPVLAQLLPRTMIAVDEEYAADDQILAKGARVAVIPPVSGGGTEL